MFYSLQAGCKEGVQTGNVAILGGHSIGHCKQQSVCVQYTYSIPSGFCERAISLYRSLDLASKLSFRRSIMDPFRFSFMGLDEE